MEKRCFKILFAVVSLSLINITSLKRKKKKLKNKQTKTTLQN